MKDGGSKCIEVGSVVYAAAKIQLRGERWSPLYCIEDVLLYRDLTRFKKIYELLKSGKSCVPGTK